MALTAPRSLAVPIQRGSASSVVIDSDDPALVDGDVRYAFFTLTSGATINSVPPGWETLLDDNIAPDTTRRVYLFGHVHDDADADFTFGFSGTSNFACAQAAVGGAALTPGDGPSRNTADTGITLTAPDRQVDVAGSMLLFFGAVALNSSGLTMTTPTGMTRLGFLAATGSSGNASQLCYEDRASTGATGTRSATSSSSGRWVAVSVVIEPAPTDVLLWEADAETNDFSAFANTGPETGGIDYLPPQTRAIVSTPSPRAGTYCYEHAVNGVASNSSQRCESRAAGINFAEGDERWFALSTYLPPGFPTNPGSWQLIHQLKNSGSGSPPVALHVENGRFELQGGAGHPSGSNPMPARNLGTAETGRWDDWLIRVLFSSDPAVGEVEVWRNGVQVLAPYKPPGGTLYPSQTSYPKYGIYRDPALSYGPETRVYHDEIRLGTSRAIVDVLDPLAYAAVTLAGAGGLSVAGAPVRVSAVNLAGAGSLSVAATPARAAAVVLAGSGALQATPGQNAAVSLAGSGALTAGAQTASGTSVMLAGAGSLTAGAQSTQQVAVALAGDGALSADGRPVRPAAVALAGAAALSAAATRVVTPAVALAGSGSLVASAVRAAAASALLAGQGNLNTAARSLAAGALNVSLWAVDRATGALTASPKWRKLSFSRIRDSAGAISVDYPANEQGFSTLRANVTDDRDLEVEIWLGGRASTRLRGILHTAAGDDVEEAAVWTFTGSFLEILLDEALVFPQPNAEKQELRFSAASPGAIVSTLLSQAQARGCLVGFTKDFTNTLDSSGQPWPEFVTIKFSPGASILAVLGKLVDLGLIEFEVTPARVLRVFRPGGMGVDRTTSTPPTIIRRGRNVTESPRRHSVRESVTTVLAAGAEGIYANATDANALARRGRRIERSTSSQNLTDLGAVQALVGRTLATDTPGEMELLLGLSFGVGHPRPQTHYAINDWVWADTVGQLEKLRVAQITMEIDAEGPTGSVTLNDLRTDWRIRAERRLNALKDGDVVIGTSTQSPGTDTVAPAPPTGVTVGSTAYQVGADDYAAVLVGWTAPTTNADGTPLFDLAGFRVSYRFPPGDWTQAPDVDAARSSTNIGELQAGAAVEVRVAAFDRDGNQSAWSSTVAHTTESDTTIPPAPSTPVVSAYLGQLKIEWDGLSNTGAAMPLDLERVEVHVSTGNNFTPSAATLVEMFGVVSGERVITDLPYGTVHYARLVAVDRSGNLSAPSGVGSATPAKVVGDDVFAGAIGTAQLAEAAITTAKIDDLAVNDAKVGSLSAGKLTAGTLSASVTLSGIFRTASTGKRMEIDSNGWRSYKADGTTKFAELSLATETMLMTGTYQSGLSGERIRLEPDGTMKLFGASGSDYGGIYNESGVIQFRSRADSNGRRSFVRFDPVGLIISYGQETGTRYSRADFGLTFGVIAAPVLGHRIYSQFTPSDGTDNRYFLLEANSGGDIGPSIWHFRSRSSDDSMVMRGIAHGAGLMFSGGYTNCLAGSDTAYGGLTANGFTTPSSGLMKTPPREIRRALGAAARDVIRAAPSQAWWYLQDLEPRPPDTGHTMTRIRDDGTEEQVPIPWAYEQPPPRLHFGPIAEDLQAVSEHLVTRDFEGRLLVDQRDLVGLLWAALAEADAEQRELARRVALLEGTADTVVVEGETA